MESHCKPRSLSISTTKTDKNAKTFNEISVTQFTEGEISFHFQRAFCDKTILIQEHFNLKKDVSLDTHTQNLKKIIWNIKEFSLYARGCHHWNFHARTFLCSFLTVNIQMFLMHKTLIFSKTGELVGRTFFSWLKLLLFYIIFCLSLSCLWGLCMGIFFQVGVQEGPQD